MDELLNIEQGKLLVEGDDAANTEVFAKKVQLTCDISVMAYQDDNGRQYYSAHLCFAFMEDEGDYEAIASLEYNHAEGHKVTSLDEIVRLLGISPDASIWVSEQ